MSSKIGHHELATLIFGSFGECAQDRHALMHPQLLFLQKYPFGVSEIGVARLKNDVERRVFFSVLPLQNLPHKVN